MTYYHDFRKYAKYVEQIMNTVKNGRKMPYDSVLYQGTLDYPVSKKAAKERLDDAITHHGFEIDSDGMIYYDKHA